MSMRDVLNERYRGTYDEVAAKLTLAGVCPRCADKVALSTVLRDALAASEMKTVTSVQIDTHGVAFVEEHGSTIPCFR